MRKSFVLVVALVVGLAMTTVGPAGAAPAEKTTYEMLECFVAFDAEPEASWFSGKDDRNWHVRGAENFALEFMWMDEAWVLVGENNIVANWNARWMVTPFGPVPTEGSLWGDSSLRATFGDFDGSWAWGEWPTGDGRATSKGINADVGKLSKATLMSEDPGWGEEPYPCPDPGFVLVEVIDPHA